MTEYLAPAALLDAFVELFCAIYEEATPAEIDAELRELGYDPDEVGRSMAEFVLAELAKVKPMGI